MNWKTQSPGWLARSQSNTYLITRSDDGRCVLSRYETGITTLVRVAQQTARHTIEAGSTMEGQRIAEAFENGWAEDPWGTVPAIAGWLSGRDTARRASIAKFRTGPASRDLPGRRPLPERD